MEIQTTAFPRKQVFFSRKGWTAGLIIWGVMLLLIIIVLIPAMQQGLQSIPWFILILVCLLILLLCWIWFGTYYILTPYYLHYYSGPFRGKIPVTAILWVKHQHTLLSGVRPALAFNGLLIRYGQYDEIYISPVDKTAFIYALQQINPNVKVKLENEL